MRPQLCAALLAASLAAPASAAATQATPAFGDPVRLADGITFDPIFSARLRLEDVRAGGLRADPLTLNLRAGGELADSASHLSALVEAMGTLAIDRDYNAFSGPTPGPQYRPGFAVVNDPETVALNRLQVAWRTRALSLTVGRQAIALDDERFVGTSPWRQNGQTFDAVRAAARAGPVALDASYVIRQNTSAGSDAGARGHLAGSFVLANGRLEIGSTRLTGFAYLLDFDPTIYRAQNNSSQTYGARAAGSVPISRAVNVAWVASYARQSNYALNPNRYSAPYALASLAVNWQGRQIGGGYELLGADRAASGTVRSVQTPFATIHKWDGWDNLFSTVPVNGLQAKYIAASTPVPLVNRVLSGFAVQASHHWFDSAINARSYGSENDVAATWQTEPKNLPRVNWMAKYAAYRANGFGVDTTKFWLQAAVAF